MACMNISLVFQILWMCFRLVSDSRILVVLCSDNCIWSPGLSISDEEGIRFRDLWRTQYRHMPAVVAVVAHAYSTLTGM